MSAVQKRLGGWPVKGPDGADLLGPDGKPQRDGQRNYSFGVLPASDAVRVEVGIAGVIGEPLFKAFPDMQSPPGGAEKRIARDPGIAQKAQRAPGAVRAAITKLVQEMS